MKDFYHRDFPDGPVVRIRHFTAMALGSIHGQRTKIPQAVQCGQKNKLIKNYKKKKKEREREREKETDIKDTELKAPVDWLSVKVREKES